MSLPSLLERRLFLSVAALALLGLAAAAVTATSQGVFAGSDNGACAAQDGDGAESPGQGEANDTEDSDNIELECEDGDESAAQPGTIDDGKDLLPQATLSLDEAIAAAQAAASGTLGEVDLERYNGALVFNVEIGGSDVKVDAGTGAVLAIAGD